MIEVFVERESEADKACFIRDNYLVYETPAFHEFLHQVGYDPDDLRWHPYSSGIVIFFPTEEMAVKFKLMF